MTKMNIWSSGVGIVSMIMIVAAITGAVLQFIDVYLPYYFKIGYQLGGVSTYLIFFILIIAGAFFALLALIISIFGIPKVLWIIFAFLALACIVATPIIILIDSGVGYFPYVDSAHAQVFLLDFIGFWLAAGGALIAMITGIFVPSD